MFTPDGFSETAYVVKSPSNSGLTMLYSFSFSPPPLEQAERDNANNIKALISNLLFIIEPLYILILVNSFLKNSIFINA